MPRGDKIYDNQGQKPIVSPRRKAAELRKLNPSGGPGRLLIRTMGAAKNLGPDGQVHRSPLPPARR